MLNVPMDDEQKSHVEMIGRRELKDPTTYGNAVQIKLAGIELNNQKTDEQRKRISFSRLNRDLDSEKAKNLIFEMHPPLLN